MAAAAGDAGALRRMFAALDTDGDGRLSAAEVARGLARAGLPVSQVTQ